MGMLERELGAGRKRHRQGGQVSPMRSREGGAHVAAWGATAMGDGVGVAKWGDRAAHAASRGLWGSR
jgi:uncharacterized Zn-binding protein involved in type VI secretion